MYTIASLLDTKTDEMVRNIWAFLEQKCLLKGIQMTPLPHISWQAAEDYDIDAVEEEIKNLALTQKAFRARATGLGIFCGFKPVLYLALVRSERLSELHDILWKRLGFYGTSHAYYDSDYWVPHITLANRDVNGQNLSCAIEELTGQLLDFDMEISSLAILYDIQGKTGVKSIYKFNG